MTAAVADWVGLVLDNRYRVAAKLGQGGMGYVYRAHDQRLRCDVVLKVPRAAMLEDAEFRQRFQDEVQALVRLAHPHVVKVSDFGQHEGVPFAVMQYLPGGSLDDRRPKTPDGKYKPVHARTLGEWLPKVAEALDFIHKQGYVHRDVKPANILFDAHKNAYISDFGVAKAVAGGKQNVGLTGAGMVLGTPAYMAPELVSGSVIDGRIDQYALAITVYEVLSGVVPFIDEQNPMRTLMRRVSEEAPPLVQVKPTTPPGLSDAVAKALAKDPADRFPDCAAFARTAIAGLSAPATSKPTPGRGKAVAETPGASQATTGTPKGVYAVQQTAPLPLAQALPDRVFSGAVPVQPSRTPRPEPPPEGSSKLLLFGGLSALAACVVIGVGMWMLLKAPDQPPKPPGDDQARTVVAPRDDVPPPDDPRPADPPPAPLPADRIEGLRPNPASVTLVAGGPAQKLEVGVERRGDGPVEVRVSCPAGIAVAPTVATAEPGQQGVTFDLTAAADVPASTDALKVTARRGGESLTRHVPLFLKRRDVRVSVEAAGEVVLRPGQDYLLPIAVNRDGGFTSPVTVNVEGSPVLQPATVVIPADKTRADLTLSLRPNAPDGPVTARVRATANGMPPVEQTVSVRVVGLSIEWAANSGSRVQAASISSNGLLAITGHENGSVKVWDLATRTVKWSSDRHAGPVLCVAFSPDNKQALSGGADKAVILWDVPQGGLIRRFHNNAHVNDPWLVHFTADMTPTSTSADKVVHWDPRTGVEKRTGGRRDIIAGKVGQKAMTYAGERLSPETKVPTDDGAYSLSGRGGDVLTVYRGSTTLATFPGHGDIKAMALRVDSRRAIAVGEDGQLRLWDVRGQRPVPGSPWPPGVTATAVALTPDGSRALVGGADGSVRVWKLPGSSP